MGRALYTRKGLGNHHRRIATYVDNQKEGSQEGKDRVDLTQSEFLEDLSGWKVKNER